MISCIICSRRPDISAELKENIASTIGCEYELVVIDNSKNEYSIFSAYNEGVHRANGDILCFMHEDILYHTFDWGKKVVEYFEQYHQAGLIGIIGTHFLSIIPSGWWDTEIGSGHLLQRFYKGDSYTVEMDFRGDSTKVPTRVVAVDGLWMCMQRNLFSKVRWDEETFNGFHAYDLDMSLQVYNAGFEVHIMWDILIEHKSYGNPNLSFHIANQHLWNKWKNFLPLVKGLEIGESEQQARTKIVELNKIIQKQEQEIARIYSSNAHKIGKVLLSPVRVFYNLYKKIEIKKCVKYDYLIDCQYLHKIQRKGRKVDSSLNIHSNRVFGVLEIRMASLFQAYKRIKKSVRDVLFF
jgi:glycosyltransferase involved in cell wall biosynthesis